MLKYRRVFRIIVNYNLFICMQSCVFKKGSTRIPNKHCLLEPNTCNAILHAVIIYTERTFSCIISSFCYSYLFQSKFIYLFFSINLKIPENHHVSPYICIICFHYRIYIIYVYIPLNVQYINRNIGTRNVPFESFLSDFALQVQQCYFVY